MPKVIENLKETILKEAKKQISEIGYSAMTMRSVAKACKIALGTLYNYFPSKEMMVASFMLDEWISSYSAMEKACLENQNPAEVFSIVYNGINLFTANNAKLFSDHQAAASYAESSSVRHQMLRNQISKLLEPICKTAKNPSPFLSEFIAQALLSWSAEKKSVDELNKILIQFF